MITEVLGFSLILPFLPLFAKDLGASALQVGLIVSLFSALQFISAPIMGKISDSVGRKPMLIISQLSTLVSFLILGFANSLWMIYLSRAIDGLFGSNQAIAQAYLSDISSKKNRSRAFGLSGMAFGAGFLVGPLTGGFLSQFGYSLPSFVAAGIATVTIITTILLLPETVKRGKLNLGDVQIFNISDFIKYFKQKDLTFFLITFTAYLFSLSSFTTNLSIFFEMRFGLDASDVGLLLAYIGLLSLVLRSPLLGKLIDMFGEHELTFTGILSMIAGFVLLGFWQAGSLVFIPFTFFAIGSAFFRPLIAGEISRNVSDKEQGAISGVLSSLGSLLRIVAPLWGGWILTNLDPRVLVFSSGFVIFFGLISLSIAEKTNKFISLNQ
jgi:DHA1 family tetracycline resistance protein-like MFS transporter